MILALPSLHEGSLKITLCTFCLNCLPKIYSALMIDDFLSAFYENKFTIIQKRIYKVSILLNEFAKHKNYKICIFYILTFYHFYKITFHLNLLAF